MSLSTLFPGVDLTLTTNGGTDLSSTDDFEVLGLALNAAGLTTTIQTSADITLFAPTDAAFADLAADFGYTGDPDDADVVFDAIAGALSGLTRDGDPIPLLTDVLLYHVAPGKQTADDPEADLTVFAPNDAAFFSLAQDMGYEGDDEAGALQAILDVSAAVNPDDTPDNEPPIEDNEVGGLGFELLGIGAILLLLFGGLA